MITDLVRAVAQLGDPAMRRALIGSVLGALAILVLLVSGAVWLVGSLGLIGISWLDGAVTALGGALALVLAWILFPSAVVIVAGLFLEDVADAVDRRHYPDLPPARRVPISESLVASLRLAGLAAILNLAVLPLYLVPGLNIVLFLVLNGYLLGREHFELVALRRMAPDAAKALRRAYSWRLLIAGMVLSVGMVVPVLNLAIPVIGTAFMAHRLEALRHRGLGVNRNRGKA